MQCVRHICLGAYASNVKYMHTSACGHIVDCSEYMRHIYSDIGVSYLHMKWFAHVTFVVGIYITIALELHFFSPHLFMQ